LECEKIFWRFLETMKLRKPCTSFKTFNDQIVYCSCTCLTHPSNKHTNPNVKVYIGTKGKIKEVVSGLLNFFVPKKITDTIGLGKESAYWEGKFESYDDDDKNDFETFNTYLVNLFKNFKKEHIISLQVDILVHSLKYVKEISDDEKFYFQTMNCSICQTNIGNTGFKDCNHKFCLECLDLLAESGKDSYNFTVSVPYNNHLRTNSCPICQNI
jgi:hypothetical protein